MKMIYDDLQRGVMMKYELDDFVISFEDIYKGLPRRLDELISACHRQVFLNTFC